MSKYYCMDCGFPNEAAKTPNFCINCGKPFGGKKESAAQTPISLSELEDDDDGKPSEVDAPAIELNLDMLPDNSRKVTLQNVLASPAPPPQRPYKRSASKRQSNLQAKNALKEYQKMAGALRPQSKSVTIDNEK